MPITNQAFCKWSSNGVLRPLLLNVHAWVYIARQWHYRQLTCDGKAREIWQLGQNYIIAFKWPGQPGPNDQPKNTKDRHWPCMSPKKLKNINIEWLKYFPFMNTPIMSLSTIFVSLLGAQGRLRGGLCPSCPVVPIKLCKLNQYRQRFSSDASSWR